MKVQSLLTITLFFTIISIVYADIQVTKDFIDAIDAATQEMIADTSFTSSYKQLMAFSVPPCVDRPDVAYPTTNPFSSRTFLTMCYEQGIENPYTQVFQLVGKTIVQKINKHYGVSLDTRFKELNISTHGFFESMRRGVDSGECDVITSNTAQTTTRQSLVHFQCNYGATAQAFLRTGLDSQITVNTFNELNRTDFKIGSLSGTLYESVVESKLTKAKFIAYKENDVLYSGILKEEIHAIIGDGVELSVWLQQNNASCTDCSVKVYTEPYTFGTFTTRNIITVSGGIDNRASTLIQVLIVLVATLLSF